MIALTSDNGGTGNNYGAGAVELRRKSDRVRLQRPDADLDAGPDGAVPGTFAPEETLTLLNGLGGKKASNSKWSLLVEDDSNANPAGTLDCWGITIKATNPSSREPEK